MSVYRSVSAATTTLSISSAPPRQTFEDWALQTSPTHIACGPTSGTTAYMETAFEDWVEQREMDFNQQPAAETSELVVDASAAAATEENGISAVEGEDSIRWEMVEGEAELRVELHDSEDTLDDGTTVRQQTVTRRRVCPVSDVLIVNGVSTECRRGTDRLLDVSIEEDILVLPPGVDDSDLSSDLRTTTNVQERKESLEDGTPVYHRITTTTIVPADYVSPSSEHSDAANHITGLELDPSSTQTDPTAVQFEHSELKQPATGLDNGSCERAEPATGLESTGGFSEPAETPTDSDIERQAEEVVAQSLEAALQEIRTTSAGRCCTHRLWHCYVLDRYCFVDVSMVSCMLM